MTVSWCQLLSDINDLFIDLTRDKIFKNEGPDFLDHVQRCLKLNQKDDWNYILASEDIIEDSIEAISSFLRFGLSGPTKYNDTGEKYLRLYGVLNATYLQQQAIFNLYKFIQCPSPNAKKLEIDNLEITSLRHKLAAHSANYEDKISLKMHVFVPVRVELDDYKFSYFNHFNDDYKTVDLKAVIECHIKLMCKTYLEVVRKTISTIYKSNKNKKTELFNKLIPFEEMLSGSILLKNDMTEGYVIIGSASAREYKE